MAEASRNIRIDELLGRSLVVFCVFIPFFAFREFRRVMGEDEFKALVFGKAEPKNPAVPNKNYTRSIPRPEQSGCAETKSVPE